jgi:hypothetical protein
MSKVSIRELLVCSFLVIVATFLFAEDWERYKETTFKEILKTESYQLEPDYNIEAVSHDFKVKVEYLGKIRDTSPEKIRLLNDWLYSHGMDKNIAKLFPREILVREGKEKYWVIVQDTLVQDMEKELKKGDSIWLFAQLWGSAKREFVFIVCRWDTA